MREPDLPYSTEIFGSGNFHPDKGKLSPIFKSGFPGVPSSVASLGDSIGKIGIDFPNPWLTKILEEKFWSQKFIRLKFGPPRFRQNWSYELENPYTSLCFHI